MTLASGVSIPMTWRGSRRNTGGCGPPSRGRRSRRDFDSFTDPTTCAAGSPRRAIGNRNIPSTGAELDRHTPLRRCEMPESILEALTVHRDASQLVRGLPRALRPLVEFDYMSVFFDREIAGGARWYVPADGDPPTLCLTPTREVPIEAMQASWVVEHQEPVVSPRLDEDTRFLGARRLLEERRFQSACALPLTTAHGRLGSLNLAAKRPYAYCEGDLPTLSRVAGHIAMAVDNALAHAELQHEQDRRRLLLEEIAELKDKLAQEKLYLEAEIRSDRNFEDIVGKSVALRRVLQQVETVAPTDSTVLDLRRDGHRQGADRAGDPQSQSPTFAGLREAELRGDPDGTAGKRAIRARAGSLHRGHRAADRAVRAGQPRHACFWTRSATSRWSCSRSCCACCRSGSSSGWAARGRCGRTRG